MIVSEKDSSSSVKDIIDSATGLVKSVPIYDDLIQPAAKQLGTTLETVAKTVNLALAPISGVVWSYETIKDFVSQKVAEKLQNVPEENIITPNPSVAGPALEALKYTGHEYELREMYANLLASSLDSETKDNAHPSSVEIIKQLTSIEAQILNFLCSRDNYKSVCRIGTSETLQVAFWEPSSESIQSREIKSKFIDLCENFKSQVDVGSVLDNLLRLKILDIESSSRQTLKESWMNSDSENIIERIEMEIEQSQEIIFTDFGVKFIDTCVKSKT